jgi:hypothetical protein
MVHRITIAHKTYLLHKGNRMGAPQTSLTIPMSQSDQQGLDVDRLYNNIKTTAFSSILTTGDYVPAIGPDAKNAMFTMIDCMCYAIAVEVVREINNHSNLKALSTDRGISGAGIISGYVR